MPGATTVQQPLRGLALPLTKVGGGYFRTKDRYDVCWGDLILAVFCPIGGQPMNRSFGSLVPNAVFEQQIPLLQQRLRQYVTDAAMRWCPHVRIVDVKVQLAGTSSTRSVSLVISFTPTDEPSVQTRQITIDRSDVMRAISNTSSSAPT
jgi:phage baseplate assembly protein W